MPARPLPAFRIQLGQTDDDGNTDDIWHDYEVYNNTLRSYYIGGGDSFEAAMAVGEQELGRHGNIFRIVETATESVVTARLLAERTIPANTERKSMIKLNVKREGGRLFLYVNASGLHSILDQIGVPSTAEMYNDRPRAAETVANRTTHTISTDALLRKQYPAKFDLSTVYTDPPPSIASLQRLTESAFEQTRKILEHYQPIDISVSIQKKDK